MPTIYYLLSDISIPSWGVGIIYYHVYLLNKNGINSKLIHYKKYFRATWIEVDIPIVYLDELPKIEEYDVLVVPEVLAYEDVVHSFKCRKIVFVQAAFYILKYTNRFQPYSDIGFESALVTMPHIRKIVERFCNIKAYVIRPFVAPYFFSTNQKREKLIVLYPKNENPDYNILIKFLRTRFDDFSSRKIRYNILNSNWKFLELKGLSHREVAKILKKAYFFVNLNSREAFNASVPEAMAAGCIPLCYEAYGGQDFLVHNENSFVFNDHYIWELLDKLIDLTASYNENKECFKQMRQEMHKVSKYYSIDNTEDDILCFFRKYMR